MRATWLPTDGRSSKAVFSMCVSSRSCSAPTTPTGLHLYNCCTKRTIKALSKNEISPLSLKHLKYLTTKSTTTKCLVKVNFMGGRTWQNECKTVWSIFWKKPNTREWKERSVWKATLWASRTETDLPHSPNFATPSNQNQTIIINMEQSNQNWIWWCDSHFGHGDESRFTRRFQVTHQLLNALTYYTVKNHLNVNSSVLELHQIHVVAKISMICNILIAFNSNSLKLVLT